MNSAYKEIWFFHPSSASTEPDTLIVYDYGQKIWWTGNISRTTYIDENPLYNKPFATTSSGIMHLHEIGTSEDNTAFTKSVKCTVEIGDGQDIMFINRLIPDWKRFTGNCTINATAYKDPQATGFSIEKEISSSTQQASLRSRGRHITVEFTSTGQQDDWEMGKLRLDVVTHGEK
jgi:hypothetical protein